LTDERYNKMRQQQRQRDYSLPLTSTRSERHHPRLAMINENEETTEIKMNDDDGATVALPKNNDFFRRLVNNNL
jgi:hypothetical protein